MGKKKPGTDVATIQNYIFGYGSLIEDASRRSTTPAARYAWPVRVKGIGRGWWARGATSGLTTTFLGALARAGKKCNGVIYAVSEDDLAATDRRETAGYTRTEIKPGEIEMLDGNKDVPPGKFWAYLNRFSWNDRTTQVPTADFPMVQSYVDICVNGCLEVEGKYRSAKGFVSEFFDTTEDWNKFWVNDRLYPRRPFIYQPSASAIDAALKAAPKTAQLFWQVEIEPASWERRTPVPPPKQEGGETEAEPHPHPHKKIGAWQCGG
jgi:hypothetical protein